MDKHAKVTVQYQEDGGVMYDAHLRPVSMAPSINVEIGYQHGDHDKALRALDRATSELRRQIEETGPREAMVSLAGDVTDAPPDRIIDTRPPEEYATSQPPMTVHLPAGMTEPAILRMVATEVRRGPLGLGGKPRSLPRTLDALADAMDERRRRYQEKETS